MRRSIPLPTLLLLLLAPAATRAAEPPAGLGLDLAEPSPFTWTLPPPDGPPPGDPFEGPAILIVPPRKAKGGWDLEAFEQLVPALRDRFGGRVLTAEQVAEAAKRLKLTPQKVATPEGRAKLARALGAERVVVLEPAAGKLYAAIHLGPNAEVLREIACPAPLKGVWDRALADAVAATLLAQAGAALGGPPPPPPPALPGPIASSDVDAELAREQRRDAPLAGPRLAVLSAGPGAGFRSSEARSGEALDTLDPRALPALSLHGALFPLRLSTALAGAAYSDVVLDVQYRKAFAEARGATQTCPVTDDALLVRALGRWRFGDGFVPRVGVGAGWGFERSIVQCDLPVPSADLRFADLLVTVAQPLAPELLELELAGGPRLLFGGEATEATATGFSAEAFVTGYLGPYLHLRGGLRTSKLAAKGPGLSELEELRTFAALEVGAYFR